MLTFFNVNLFTFIYYMKVEGVCQMIQGIFWISLSVWTKFDDTDINKVRKHDEKPSDQMKFYTCTTLLVNGGCFSVFWNNFRIGE